MKVPIMILNAMFLLMFVSVIIGEWGEAPAMVAGIATVNLLINMIVIQLRVKNTFGREASES